MDLLAVTGGHRVDLAAFAAMLDAVSDEQGWRWAHAVQPAAQRWLKPGTPWDVLVLHDIAGLGLVRGEPPEVRPPPDRTRTDLVDLLDEGRGVVVLHHALASWPTWDEWAGFMGGRFLYAPGTLRGRPEPSGGTKLVRYRARPVAGDHPILSGVGEADLDDEVYLCPVFEDEVVPLVRGDFDTDGASFISTYEHVLVGEERAPRCEARRASDLIAWATTARRSPVVYIQPGDSGATFAMPWYRRLLANAIRWAASGEARAWAAQREGR